MAGSSAPGRLRQRSKMEGRTTLIHHNPRGKPINAMCVAHRGSPGSRTRASSHDRHSLPGLPLFRLLRRVVRRTRSPRPRVRFQHPADSVEPSIGFPDHAGYTSLPFSRRAVKWLAGRICRGCGARCWSSPVGPPGCLRRARLPGEGLRAARTRPGGVAPATRFSPAGASPHSDSFQIKQQHCEVRRGDAADAARLPQTGRPDPVQLLARLVSKLRNGRVVEL